MFIGAKISHFHVLEKIGQGGMGEVYLAEDTILHRRVALKFLKTGRSEAERSRIIAEARAAAAIDHPGVCKVFEAGEVESRSFIAMELLEGDTLEKRISRGAMAVQEALPLVIEISEALSEAHGKRLVHCDLKPSNVMITGAGHVKLMDFGLARRIREPASAEDETMTLRTAPPGIAGTPGYMAPEQAKGEAFDGRADLFSLGIIFYEMLCGVHPFRRNTSHATVAAILYEDAPDIRKYLPDAPPLLADIVSRALERNPETRYASAAEFRSDLIRLRDATRLEPARSRATLPSVAILPFQDLSAAGDQGYFCDGLAEELIVALGRIKRLRVVARSAAFHYRNSALSLSEIGNTLKAAMILEGSLRKSGERVRIVVNLVEVASASSVWTEVYDRRLDDIFEVQDEIARAITQRLRVTMNLLSSEAASTGGTQNARSYEAYLKGRYLWNRRTERNVRLSIAEFEKALIEDPEYALPWVGLADACITLALYGAASPMDMMPRAKQAVNHALGLNPELAEAFMSRGCVRAIFDWDWNAAETDFEQAIRVNPRSAQTRQWFAMNCLAPQRRFERARSELKIASELEPMSLAIATSPGILDLFRGDYDAAIRRFQAVLELEEGFYLAHYFLAQACSETSMHQDAIREAERAVAITNGSSESLSVLGYIQAAAGNEAASSRVLQMLLDRRANAYVSPVLIAQIQVGLSRTDAAIENLIKALEVRATDLMWIAVRPAFARVRRDPRVREILSRHGLGIPAQTSTASGQD